MVLDAMLIAVFEADAAATNVKQGTGEAAIKRHHDVLAPSLLGADQKVAQIQGAAFEVGVIARVSPRIDRR